MYGNYRRVCDIRDITYSSISQILIRKEVRFMSPVLFPNLERLLNDIKPFRKLTVKYSLADDVTVDQLNSDERWLLGII